MSQQATNATKVWLRLDKQYITLKAQDKQVKMNKESDKLVCLDTILLNGVLPPPALRQTVTFASHSIHAVAPLLLVAFPAAARCLVLDNDGRMRLPCSRRHLLSLQHASWEDLCARDIVQPTKQLLLHVFKSLQQHCTGRGCNRRLLAFWR